MRAILFLLVLLTVSYAAGFGQARQILERTWIVTNNGSFDFTASMIVNNSNQQIFSIKTEPEMTVTSNENGQFWLNYSGEGVAILRATIVVDVDYDPKIIYDAQVPKNNINFTNLTLPDEKIIFRTEKLVNDSSLITIYNIVDWVHNYVTYDLTYWDKTKSAQEVFVERRGVCVEYSHLLLSMLGAAGFEARYVSGYVYTTAWQPHAWVEIYLPEYGWVAADPTFNQIGTLDSSHIAIAYGPDQSYIYDSISTWDYNATLSLKDDIRTNFENADPKGIEMKIFFENDIVTFEITNTRPYYTYGTYGSSMANVQDSQLLLINPSSRMNITRSFDESIFNDEFVYTVPVIAWFNDAQTNKTFQIAVNDEEGVSEATPQCLPMFLLASLFLFAIKQ